MTGRSLSRRLERLEEHTMPEDEPTVWEIILVDSDGTRTTDRNAAVRPTAGIESADTVAATSLSNETRCRISKDD
jgi:hypothetical protein